MLIWEFLVERGICLLSVHSIIALTMWSRYESTFNTFIIKLHTYNYFICILREYITSHKVSLTSPDSLCLVPDTCGLLIYKEAILFIRCTFCISVTDKKSCVKTIALHWYIKKNKRNHKTVKKNKKKLEDTSGNIKIINIKICCSQMFSLLSFSTVVICNLIINVFDRFLVF
jgi:hypothetical protein